MKKKARPAPAKKMSPVTFSWVYPLVLTHRCIYRCGYCPYPETAGPALPSKTSVQETLAFARSLGLLQVRITGGEGLEIHPDVVATYRYYGYGSFVEYLRGVIGELAQNGVATPLFPELDLGALSLFQMQSLRSHIFTLRLFLDSMDPKLQHGVVHGRSEGKWSRNRVAALLTAGRLGIPVNSGMMVGIGEEPQTRVTTLRTLGEIARRYGHIQSVNIRPFEPEPRTPMSHVPPPRVEDLLETVAHAREILPPQVKVQFPIFKYPERVMDFVQAGLQDLGDFELCQDLHQNTLNINAFKIVRERLRRAGVPMTDRLSLFPEYSNPDWTTPRYQELLRCKALISNPVEESVVG